MNSRELVRWSRLHDSRARKGWWTSPYAIAIALGGLFAAWVAWRTAAGPVVAGRAWLAAALAAFGLAFLRVPFLVYWRADAPLLAQLPIEGRTLFDAALVRCLGAAATTTAIAVLGSLPLARISPELAARHAGFALALGTAAAGFLPAVAVWAASLVSSDRNLLAAATALAGAPASGARPEAPPAGGGSSSALLGAIPGFAATIVVVFAVLASPWLVGKATVLPPLAVLAGIAGASVLVLVGVRATSGTLMGTILRDVSALDRQRLATLEIRPPTALESRIARLLGEAALPYSKDARLMRRRYPMAFALGALAFLVLVITGLTRPTDPIPWLAVTLVGTTAYALTLTGRLDRPPIELPRLATTLPISAVAQRRAKRAWILGWWVVYVAVPGVFATLRQPDPLVGVAILGGATLVTVINAVARR